MSIQLQKIDEKSVPRPYTDITYLITDGVYASDFTAQQLFHALKEVYIREGLELQSLKPTEITLRKYLDANKESRNQPVETVTERSEPGQPEDEQVPVQPFTVYRNPVPEAAE